MSDVLEPVGGAEPPTAHVRERRRFRLRSQRQARSYGWIVRGLVLAVLHSAARAVLGVTTNALPLHSGLLRWTVSAVVVIIALAWGLADGRSRGDDASSAPDTTLDWLRAGILGGVVSGLIVLGLANIDALYIAANGAIFELTSGIGWTFLLIFLPAVIGVALTRVIAQRRSSRKSATREPAEVS